MRSRSTITAAFALAAATILAVSACGGSVSGSAAVNSAAAQTLTSTSESSTSTSRTTSTRTTTSEESTPDTTTSEETTETEDTTSVDLSGLEAFGGACINVSLTYLAATVAPFATLTGGSTPYDGTDLQEQLNSLKSEADIPPEIAGDLQAIEEVTSQANGATLSEAGALFGSEKFTTASDNISKWLDANCGG